MSNIWTYILDNLCNLHTTNAILAMDLMFKPFLMSFLTFWQKIVKICSSCLLWSNFFTCRPKKQPNQNQKSSVNINPRFTYNFIKIFWIKNFFCMFVSKKNYLNGFWRFFSIVSFKLMPNIYYTLYQGLALLKTGKPKENNIIYNNPFWR